jgi:hypothetical protein
MSEMRMISASVRLIEARLGGSVQRRRHETYPTSDSFHRAGIAPLVAPVNCHDNVVL